MSDRVKDALLNGAAMLDTAGAAPAVDPQLRGLLVRLLADVEAGKISSIACLTVSPAGQAQWPGAGTQAAELYIGAVGFQRAIEAAMFGKPGGRILRA